MISPNVGAHLRKLPPIHEGQRFGRLTVLAHDDTKPGHGVRWRVRCECGKELTLRQDTLRKQLACGPTCAAQLRRTAPEPPPVVGARWIALTKGKFALVDSEDFERVNSLGSWSFGGEGKHGYAVRIEKGRTTKMHTVVLGGVRFVDHENGNRLDNRKSNLRPATTQQNNFNRGANKIGTSRFKGVSRKARPGKKTWIAQISRDGRHEFLGHFEIEEEAARAYDAAARRLFGKFARVNFPSEASW